MTLPYLPLRTGDVEKDVQALYTYLYDFLDNFDNSAGSAIDPSVGQGGDSSLTIVDVPLNITYTPGSSLSVDGSIFGHIDVTFEKPERVVDVIIFYKESSDLYYKQSYASESPFRLIGLMVGTEYSVYMAGQAANGSLGPLSDVEAIEIPTDILETSAPTDFIVTSTYQSVVLEWVAPVGNSVALEYRVQRADDEDFTVNVITWSVDATRFVDDTGVIDTLYYYRVQSIDRAGSPSGYTDVLSTMTSNVPDGSILYSKIQEVTSTHLLGRGDSGDGDVEEIDIGTNLSLIGTTLDTAFVLDSGVYTPTLVNVSNLDASTSNACQYLRVGNSVVVSGFVDVDPTTGGVNTELGISLPIPSAFTVTSQCGGVASSTSSNQETAPILTDVSNARARMLWVAGVTSNTSMFFIFMYKVV